MSAIVDVDRATLQAWLDNADTEYYLCNQCEGLHLPALQQLEGAVDSRLFEEPYGLLLSTELEVRPVALFPLAAELARLNMDFPTLKLFLDVVDDATPQLVVAGVLPATAGLSGQQFADFLEVTMEATARVAADTLASGYLFTSAEADTTPPSTALH
jgi:hypothetical protein